MHTAVQYYDAKGRKCSVQLLPSNECQRSAAKILAANINVVHATITSSKARKLHTEYWYNNVEIMTFLGNIVQINQTENDNYETISVVCR